MKGVNRWAVFFGIFSLCIIVFIFENSMQSRLISSGRSSFFVHLLRPLLERIPWIPAERYDRVVRKTAHFTEFFLLGFSLTGLYCTLPGKRRGIPGFAPALTSLLTAAADETIQLFSDRTGSVLDAALDFTGALCGMLAARICRKLRALYRRRYRIVPNDKF